MQNSSFNFEEEYQYCGALVIFKAKADSNMRLVCIRSEPSILKFIPVFLFVNDDELPASYVIGNLVRSHMFFIGAKTLSPSFSLCTFLIW